MWITCTLINKLEQSNNLKTSETCLIKRMVEEIEKKTIFSVITNKLWT